MNADSRTLLGVAKEDSIFSLKNEPEGGSEAIRRKGLLSWLI
jgi:hypothetical protein